MTRKKFFHDKQCDSLLTLFDESLVRCDLPDNHKGEHERKGTSMMRESNTDYKIVWGESKPVEPRW